MLVDLIVEPTQYQKLSEISDYQSLSTLFKIQRDIVIKKSILKFNKFHKKKKNTILV